MSRVEPVSRPLRAALVGAGQIARQHLACLKELPLAQVCAVCDLSRAKAEHLAERFAVPVWYQDFPTMLERERPDVVHITSSAESHFPLARLALEAGAHAFVEKPIALTRGEFSALRALAEERRRALVEDHNYLFSPTVERTLALYESGEMGDVVHVEVSFCVGLAAPDSPFADRNHPHPALHLPGGPIFDFLPHLAYLALAFAGECMQAHVTWRKVHADGALEWDEFRAALVCERATASLAFSARAQPNIFALRVYGTRLRAELDLLEPSFVVHRLGRGRPAIAIFRAGLEQAKAMRRAAFAGLWQRLGDTPGPYQGMWNLIALTYAALREGRPPPVSLEQIDAVQHLLERLIEARSAPCLP